MAHIANKIDAKDKKLSEVLNGQRYRIDSFQREYRWQRKQIEALISDLVISFKKNHKSNHTVKNCSDYDCYYMGPIVLCDNKNELSIVDGQQRLSSFTLLFIYLFHQQSKITGNNLVLRDLKPFLYVTKAGETTFVLNVRARNKVLEHLITNPEKIFTEIEALEDENNDLEQEEQIINRQGDESISNLIERYEDITKLFPEDIKNTQVLPIFIEWLLEKVVIVEVKAYSMENAYTIFETMNDRGMTLNPTEILKAFLLHKIDDDDAKSDEVNEFWKERISEIKSSIGNDTELDFFRAWLRAKYAESKRESRQGSENEDFEIIGTQFHSWVKNNPDKVNLFSSDDYYFFIQSDFNFFSNLYKKVYAIKSKKNDGFEDIYFSNSYPLADSLSFPLFLSPILKIDDENTIDQKLKLIGKFIDVYTCSRTIRGKTITQSSIRYTMYELVKNIRDLEYPELLSVLRQEIDKNLDNQKLPLLNLTRMDNWGFYHYFFARLINYLGSTKRDFSDLLRSRKQSSLVLHKIFNEADAEYIDIDPFLFEVYHYSVAGYCLVQRNDLEKIENKISPWKRIKYLMKQGYLPEINSDFNVEEEGIINFINLRDANIQYLANQVWNFPNRIIEVW